VFKTNTTNHNLGYGILSGGNWVKKRLGKGAEESGKVQKTQQLVKSKRTLGKMAEKRAESSKKGESHDATGGPWEREKKTNFGTEI